MNLHILVCPERRSFLNRDRRSLSDFISSCVKFDGSGSIM